ncbi:MAG: cell division protein FtsQ/DivIB [Alphaproteobacteria bacterium]
MRKIGNSKNKARKAPQRPQRAGARASKVATPGSTQMGVTGPGLWSRFVRLWGRSVLLRRTSYACLATLTAGALGVAVANSTIPERTTQWVNETVDQTLIGAGFVIDDVTVAGRHRTSRDDLMDALRIVRDMPIMSLDPTASKARLEALPWVEEARVARLLPDTVHVVLIEREPFAIWQRQNKLNLIDREGALIEGVDLGPYAALPIIAGDGAPDHAAEILDLLRAEPQLGAKVDAAVRVGNRRWNVRLANGVTIALPEVDPARAWAFLSDLQQEQDLLSREIDMIDLRQDSRITIRAKKVDGKPGRESRLQIIKAGGEDA